jgi:hypothetical protein
VRGRGDQPGDGGVRPTRRVLGEDRVLEPRDIESGARSERADHRKFQYSWIGYRAAASPQQLATATEHKLFAAVLYDLNAQVTAYNDSRIGPPEVRIHQLDPAVASCLVVAEPGAVATASGVSLAMLCGRDDPAVAKIALFERPTSTETWGYRSTLLSKADGQSIHAAIDGMSAPELVADGEATWLLATPTGADAYHGCVGYGIDLAAGTLADLDHDGHADPLFAVAPETSFGGACTYNAALGQHGLLYSEAHLGETPTFWIIATGVVPP